MDDETIVALATPPGRAGIAVIRLSGSQSADILAGLVAPFPGKPQARHSYHGFIQDGAERIDECLAVLFRGPASYSGEDMVEISLHSNLFVIERALALICRLGARQALPGEFTYRAFRNGKLDLLQAEAVNDLIQANSQRYSLMEFNNLEGRLSREVSALRDALLQAAVEVETRIEFAEDQHIAEPAVGAGLAAAGAALERILAASRFNEVLNRGWHVVIAGRVNVGKSSLFNALLLKERSIISALPGTTRDYIQEDLHLDGFTFRVTDMAGIRSASGDEIENQGMQRSLDKIAQADAVLFVVDASQLPAPGDLEIYRLLAGKKRVLLANKSDLAPAGAAAGIGDAFPGETVHLVSAMKGDNLEAAVDFLKSLPRQIPEPPEAIALNLRQRQLLEKLREKTGRIMGLLERTPAPAELVAEEIRQGLGLIGELTGAVGSADILRGVFAAFCIGK